jgi:hypothetical protein
VRFSSSRNTWWARRLVKIEQAALGAADEEAEQTNDSVPTLQGQRRLSREGAGRCARGLRKRRIWLSL